MSDEKHGNVAGGGVRERSAVHLSDRVTSLCKVRGWRDPPSARGAVKLTARSAQRTPLCPAHGGKVVATVRTLACLVDALKQKGFVTFHDRSKICRSPGASGLRPPVEENIVDWRRQE